MSTRVDRRLVDTVTDGLLVLAPGRPVGLAAFLPMPLGGA